MAHLSRRLSKLCTQAAYAAAGGVMAVYLFPDAYEWLIKGLDVEVRR